MTKFTARELALLTLILDLVEVDLQGKRTVAATLGLDESMGHEMNFGANLDVVCDGILKALGVAEGKESRCQNGEGFVFSMHDYFYQASKDPADRVEFLRSLDEFAGRRNSDSTT